MKGGFLKDASKNHKQKSSVTTKNSENAQQEEKIYKMIARSPSNYILILDLL